VSEGQVPAVVAEGAVQAGVEVGVLVDVARAGQALGTGADDVGAHLEGVGRIGQAVVAQGQARRRVQERVVLVEGAGLAVAGGQLDREVVAAAIGIGVRGLGVELDVVGQVEVEATEQLVLAHGHQGGGVTGIGAVAADVLVAGAGGLAGQERTQHPVADELLVQHRARVRTGGDLAAERAVATTDVHRGGEGRGDRAAAGQGVDAPPVRPIEVGDVVGLAALVRAQQVAATAQDLGPAGDAELVAIAVAVGGDAGVGFDLQAGELLVDDEVHDAGHGVRAVDRRGAARDDVDARDQHLRDRVDVDGAVGVGRRQAMAVHQHQRALGAEAAQGQDVLSLVAGAVARTGRDRRALEDRQLVQTVRQAAGRRLLDLFGRDHRHRRRRVGGDRGDARAGHGDRLHDLRVIGVSRRGLLRHGVAPPPSTPMETPSSRPARRASPFR
jgi:hypothetical protein